MKLREAVSWLMGSMQRNLIDSLEECCERPLSEKERQLVCILELVQIENLVASSPPQRFGRKRHNRRVWPGPS